MINKLLDSYTGRVLISIIWGLGLATLFKKSCTNNRCIVIKNPGKDVIENNTYSYQGMKDCLKLKPVLDKCEE